jgi:hypothetical protein
MREPSRVEAVTRGFWRYWFTVVVATLAVAGNRGSWLETPLLGVLGVGVVAGVWLLARRWALTDKIRGRLQHRRPIPVEHQQLKLALYGALTAIGYGGGIYLIASSDFDGHGILTLRSVAFLACVAASQIGVSGLRNIFRARRGLQP